MYDVATGWYTAQLQPGREILVLIECLGLGLTIASRPWPGGELYRLNEGLVMHPRLLMGGVHPQAQLVLPSLPSGVVSALGSQLDPYSGQTQIAQMTVRLSNTTDWWLEAPQPVLKTPVRVALGIGPGLALSDLLPLFYGHVEAIKITPETVDLTCVPGAFSWHHDLSTLLGDHYFQDVVESSRGQSIPIMVGFAADVECIPLTRPLVATLALPLSDQGTDLFVAEFHTPFPTAGAVDIGPETGVTYAQRSLVTLEGRTLLRLAGLVRPAPVAHEISTTVTGSTDGFRYLVGYQCTVLAVRVDGVSVPLGGYAVQTLQADFPVTVLRFNTPQGTVTADVDGWNLGNPYTLVPNGGFETGALPPWTAAAGSATVSAGSTPFGTYKATVQGGAQDVDGTLLQDVPVVPGRGLMVLWHVRRNQSALQDAILNGDFAAQLTNWTYTEATRPPGELTIRATYPTTFDGPAGIALLPETTLKYVDILWSDLLFTYTLVLSQDVTVSIGTPYTLESQHGFLSGDQPLAPDPATWGAHGPTTDQTASNAAVPPVSAKRTGTVTVTSVASGALVWSGTLVSHFAFGMPHGPVLWGVHTLSGPVTPTVSALRVSITYQGEFLGYPPLGMQLLGVKLVPSATLSTSAFALDLGNTTDQAAYATVEATAPPLFWSAYAAPAVPLDATLRISARSRYDNGAVPTPAWLDQVAFAEQGRHPVDVIRWLIETRLPGLRIHEPSFRRAYLARADWRCGGQWRDPGHSLAVLQDLADQFEMRYFENGNGEAVLVPIDLDAPPVVTLSRENAAEWSAEPESAVHLATDIYVYYAPRSAQGGTDPAAYGGSVFATPEASSGEDVLIAACSLAVQLYGVRQVLRVFCAAITDQATALLKLTALVARRTINALLVTCTSVDLRVAPLEIGDMVTMTHPILGPFPLVGEVTSVQNTLGRPGVVVTARLAVPAGIVETWDAPTLVVQDGMVESWEP
jgi:hypothetical protein